MIAFWFVTGVFAAACATFAYGIFTHRYNDLPRFFHQFSGFWGFAVVYLVIILPFYLKRVKEKKPGTDAEKETQAKQARGRTRSLKGKREA